MGEWSCPYCKEAKEENKKLRQSLEDIRGLLLPAHKDQNIKVIYEIAVLIADTLNEFERV